MADRAASEASKVVASAFDDVKEWTDEEHQRYLDSLGDAEEHPLFRDVSPDEAADFGEAMRAADVADDREALSSAVKRKDRGNAAFKKGPEFFGNALRHYKDALGLAGQVEDSPALLEERRALESVLHSNIAAVYMKRRVWHRALGATEEALVANPSNGKAAFRKGSCCVELGQFQKAVDALRPALGFTEGAAKAAVERLLARAEDSVRVAEERRAATAAKLAERERRVAAARRACAERGLRIGKPLMKDMVRTSDAVPSVDEDGTMHWPVTLLFPARGISEMVQSCAESASVRDLVAAMLPATRGSGPPAPWDTEGAYTVDNVSVFYRTHETPQVPAEALWAAQIEGAEAAADDDDADLAASRPAADEPAREWIRVPLAAPLVLPLLQPDCVVPGMPVLYVVPSGSEAESLMRRDNGGSIRELRVPELSAP
ncbi:hypothetical protein FNF27_07373 [Cafeteria roenbergensis]|nr:hypothetical protein FNF29_07099 [Cafeteria roenbergensis]KAA0167290.1 hypothetical protein FNF27_07373 [Cafeteria roenbergensis]|eukprot:KAA0147887.1 hypothetical protein FNF29_07099 [Cafeteria roenbergensis]